MASALPRFLKKLFVTDFHSPMKGIPQDIPMNPTSSIPVANDVCSAVAPPWPTPPKIIFSVCTCSNSLRIQRRTNATLSFSPLFWIFSIALALSLFYISDYILSIIPCLFALTDLRTLKVGSIHLKPGNSAGMLQSAEPLASKSSMLNSSAVWWRSWRRMTVCVCNSVWG
ncbi:uncharacterized protein K444DRAFT_260670 [Hyaloscypha bicolor E]|uniref:Uncharacterized protein n=1 Tax=Hyaloscypha bicolor E TaxID=1095630 RepID=A0A2J6SHC5_9HELO|nr:uncharacterized protein K444DRAFT_260670 [Hyaloscypha bicolor E]PMD50175.1 hypothetical protein K444DRAFT_260670 [Hyaloscypha bicolor E]